MKALKEEEKSYTHTHTRAQRLLTEWDKIITACC